MVTKRLFYNILHSILVKVNIFLFTKT